MTRDVTQPRRPASRIIAGACAAVIVAVVATSAGQFVPRLAPPCVSVEAEHVETAEGRRMAEQSPIVATAGEPGPGSDGSEVFGRDETYAIGPFVIRDTQSTFHGFSHGDVRVSHRDACQPVDFVHADNHARGRLSLRHDGGSSPYYLSTEGRNTVTALRVRPAGRRMRLAAEGVVALTAALVLISAALAIWRSAHELEKSGALSPLPSQKQAPYRAANRRDDGGDDESGAETLRRAALRRLERRHLHVKLWFIFAGAVALGARALAALR